MGPNVSGTTYMEHKGKVCTTGSTEMETFLKKYREQILFHQHGHSHDGWGMFNYGGFPVINPGSAGYTQTYGEIELRKDDKWEIESVKFLNF